MASCYLGHLADLHLEICCWHLPCNWHLRQTQASTSLCTITSLKHPSIYVFNVICNWQVKKMPASKTFPALNKSLQGVATFVYPDPRAIGLIGFRNMSACPYFLPRPLLPRSRPLPLLLMPSSFSSTPSLLIP